MITKKEFSQALTDNASVAAGLVPIATNSSNGLLTATQHQWLFPITNKVGTSNERMVVKASMFGKLSFLLGFMKNRYGAGLLYISFDTIGESISPFAKWIAKESSVKFLYKQDGKENLELYVSGLSSWAECGFIRLTGSINEVTIVDVVPEDAVEITISD